MPADKFQIFPQIDAIILGVWPGMPKLPKKQVCCFFAISYKKEVSDEIDFLHVNKHESLLQIDTVTLIGIVKHSQSSPFPKFPSSQGYNVFTMYQKRS